MNPEEAMIDEGRRRAAAAAVDNLSFVVGGATYTVVHGYAACLARPRK
jgi:hypothetical protein